MRGRTWAIAVVSVAVVVMSAAPATAEPGATGRSASCDALSVAADRAPHDRPQSAVAAARSRDCAADVSASRALCEGYTGATFTITDRATSSWTCTYLGDPIPGTADTLEDLVSVTASFSSACADDGGTASTLVLGAIGSGVTHINASCTIPA